VKGFRRLLSTDKPIFRLRKATKITSKLLRPFFFGLDIEKGKCFYKLKPPLKISRSAAAAADIVTVSCLACTYYAGIILRIIGHQFRENNSGIIERLQE